MKSANTRITHLPFSSGVALGVTGLALAWSAIAWFTRALQEETAAIQKHIADTHGLIRDEKGTSRLFSPHPHTVHVRHGHYIRPTEIPECISFVNVLNGNLHPGNMTIIEPGQPDRQIVVKNDLISSVQCFKVKSTVLVKDKALTKEELDLFFVKFGKELNSLVKVTPSDYHQKLARLINNIEFTSQKGKAGKHHYGHHHSLPLGSGGALVSETRSRLFHRKDGQTIMFYTDENYDERKMEQVVGNLINNLKFQLGAPSLDQKKLTRPGRIR